MKGVRRLGPRNRHSLRGRHRPAQVQGGVIVGTAPGAVRPGLPPRDPNEKVPTGTGGGQRPRDGVVLRTPLRHAQVMLNAADQAVRRTTTTDADGRYRFADLPAGRYFLTVNKAGYVSLNTDSGVQASLAPRCCSAMASRWRA